MNWTLKYIDYEHQAHSLATENLSKSKVEENETRLLKSNDHPLKQVGVKHNIRGENGAFKQSSLISLYIHQRQWAVVPWVRLQCSEAKSWLVLKK